MKFVALVNKILLTVIPISILCHLGLTLILLSNHIESRAAYLIGDGIIALWAILAVLKAIVFSASEKPLEYYTPPPSATFIQRYTWAKPLLVLILVGGAISLLYSMRLSYTGPLYDGTVIQNVENQGIKTPMLSDEWVIAGYVQDAAHRRALPTFNIFENAPPIIYNFLSPLISVLAGFMVSTGLDIFSHYWVYVFVFQMFFVYVFFAFLRSINISWLGSAVGVSLLVFLPQSNLIPGIWVMLPAYVGLPFVLLGYLALQEYQYAFAYRYRVYMWMSLIVACLFYPPYLVLSVIYFLLFGLVRRKLGFLSLLYSFIGVLVLIYIVLYSADITIEWSNWGNIFNLLWHPIVHGRFGISTGVIWQLIPFVFFITAILGAYAMFRSTMVSKTIKQIIGVAIFMVGVLLGAVYYANIEVIISHQRLVFLSWLLMIVMTLYFLDFICPKIFKNIKGQPYSYIFLGLLICFQVVCLTVWPYSELVRWKGAAASLDIDDRNNIESRPVAALMFFPEVRETLQKLVSGSSTPKILASPYASLAVGAMTDMNPISTVDAYVSRSGPSYGDFIKIEACGDKYAKALEWNLTYVIVHMSEQSSVEHCPKFSLIQQLPPYYYLYEVIKP